MILSDGGLLEAIGSGEISIDPSPQESQFKTSSLDLRIGNEFFEWDKSLTDQPGIDVNIDIETYSHKRLSTYMKKVSVHPDGKIHLIPDHFYLAQTLEAVRLPLTSGYAARVEGRSGLARLGISVHQTAPTIHCGFEGTITLEILNHGPFPILITPRISRLCQLVVEKLDRPPERGFSSRFQGQSSPAGS